MIQVDDSWWPTRVKQGVHVKNAGPRKLEEAKRLAWLLGTNTVYHYTNIRVS